MGNEKYNDNTIRPIVEEAGYIYCGFERRKGSQIYVGFICPKHQHKGIQYTLLTQFIKKKECCGVCNGRNRNTEDFKIMLAEILPDIEVIGEYTGARERIKVRCKVCGKEWEPLAYNLLSGYGCPRCYDERRGELHHKEDNIKLEKLQSMHPDVEFIKIPYYARDNVVCRCKVCGCEWEASYTNLTKKTGATGCPECNASKGEMSIKEILEKYNINYVPQKIFDDLKDIRHLKFDFYLPDFNTAIEYDGEFHYYTINNCKNIEQAENNHSNLVKHDNMKNEYCSSNGINLIRIPYWDYDRIEEIIVSILGI